MGDRALVIFHDHAKKQFSPAVYLHWAGGEGVATHLAELKALMADRLDDVGYATARFIGLCHSANPGNLSIGVNNLDAGFEDTEAFAETITPGDAGVFLVDAKTWETRCFAGYGLPGNGSEAHG